MWKQLFTQSGYDFNRFRQYRNEWIENYPEEWELTEKLIRDFNAVKIDDSRKISQTTFTIFDIETTGFYAGLGDEMISIGALYLENGKAFVNNTFYSLVYAAKPVPEAVTEITGLTSAETNMGEDFPRVLRQFLQFTKNTVLVAHPASFDIPFLQTLCRRWKLPIIRPVVVDSFLLAKLLYPGADNSLDSLLQRFHMPVIERHHALNDAVITAELFQNLLDAAQEKNYHSLKELLKELNAAGRKRRSR
ncbi:3'-5' exonuclease [Alkalicoccus daliensis]|uniref:DNA polymerase-3 subunit epsilon n=1 Tax=Alkalicoccus daliensis TaxID=745820 RepID=A0A1H0AHP7_9BACI|nr:exonuclease domain-containing protein [Alkalicoccus daliensis]SDN32306.1 DNA polymerase-3 subunit epsilon [Alkalicoccus daliensis]